MGETSYEHNITFKLTKRFFKDMNRNYSFDVNNMNQHDDEEKDVYQILLSSALPDNIYDCIYDDTSATPGKLKPVKDVPGWSTILTDITSGIDLKLNIEWVNDGEAGFIIHIANKEDIQIPLSEEKQIALKGLMIYNVRTNYMIAYARLSNPVQIQNFITIPFDTDLGGVGVCPNTTTY